MLNFKRYFAALTVLGLLAPTAGAQSAQSSLDGLWTGALRCNNNARVSATLTVRTVGGSIEAVLLPTSVEGDLGGGANLSPIQLRGVLSGATLNFTSSGQGGVFPGQKAVIKDGGRTIAGNLTPSTGCSGLYFTRSAPTLAQATTPAPAPQPAGTDASGLTGVWVGRYICAQGSTGLLMAVQGQADGMLQTRFSFYPLPENPFVPAGSLDVRSQRQGDQLVNLQSTWVSRPADFTFGAGGKITLSEDGQTLTIVPEGAQGCLSMEVVRQP